VDFTILSQKDVNIDIDINSLYYTVFEQQMEVIYAGMVLDITVPSLNI
jgi:hypothetical protein